MDYITAREEAEKWGVSERRVNQYCTQGRVPGAERFDGSWAIPANAEKPGDPRKQKTQAASPSAEKAPELFLRLHTPDEHPVSARVLQGNHCPHGSRAEKGHCPVGVPLFQ